MFLLIGPRPASAARRMCPASLMDLRLLLHHVWGWLVQVTDGHSASHLTSLEKHKRKMME